MSRTVHLREQFFPYERNCTQDQWYAPPSIRADVSQLRAPPMRQWLTSLLQLNSVSGSSSPWPPAYESLTAPAESTGSSTPIINDAVEVAAAAAALARVTLCSSHEADRRYSETSPKDSTSIPVFNYSRLPLTNNANEMPTARLPHNSRCANGRPCLRRIRSKQEFLLHFLARYMSVISVTIATLLLCYAFSWSHSTLRNAPHHTAGSPNLALEDMAQAKNNKLLLYQSSMAPFFLDAADGIKEMALRQVAEKLGTMHSQISRTEFNETANQDAFLNKLKRHDSTLDAEGLFIDSRQFDRPSNFIADSSKAEKNLYNTEKSIPEFTFARWDLALCTLLLIYVCLGYVLDRLPFILLHESVVSVAFGIFLGLFFINRSGTIRFDFNLFNYILLPPIIFGAGFTLKKRMFYRFFGYATSFGIFLTLMMFVLLANCLDLVQTRWPFRTLDGYPIPGLNYETFLVLSAVLCCSDTVAALAFIKPDQFPAAHAVVFGEGVLNDVVSIILSQSLIGVAQMRLDGQIMELPISRLVRVLLSDVVYYLLTSSIVGMGFGLLISYVFKKCHKTFNRDPVRAVALIFVGSYMSYILSEMLGYSAILSIFLCGIVTGHYAWHSLTPSGRILANKSSNMISFCAEAFVFGYFGVAASSIVSQPQIFSLTLIGFISVIIPLCRCVGTIFIYFFICIIKCEFRLTLKPQDRILLLIGGMMRGTVSYALIIHYVQQSQMDYYHVAKPHNTMAPVLISTVLGVVLGNVVFFGITLPTFCQWLTGPRASTMHSSDKNALKDVRHIVTLALDSMTTCKKKSSSQHQQDIHHTLSQPLLLFPNTPPSTTPSGCSTIFSAAPGESSLEGGGGDSTRFPSQMMMPDSNLLLVDMKKTDNDCQRLQSKYVDIHHENALRAAQNRPKMCSDNDSLIFTAWTSDDALLLGETILRIISQPNNLDISCDLWKSILDFLINRDITFDKSTTSDHYSPPYDIQCPMTAEESYSIDDNHRRRDSKPLHHADSSIDIVDFCQKTTEIRMREETSKQLKAPPYSFWKNCKPDQVRKGVDRWWHRFDNQIMKPVFGGQFNNDTPPSFDANTLGNKKVERYQQLLREVFKTEHKI